MFLKKITVGPFQCNCTILACEKSKEAVVIDPGDEPQRIVEILEQEGLKPKYLLQTHAHLDHVGGTHGVFEKYRGEVCLHREDQFLYDNVPMQAALFGLAAPPVCPVTQYIGDGDILAVGNHKVEIFHTPGHTPGSVSFYLKEGEQELLFTGDTLFMGSIGRTDLWGGDHNLILKSIKDKILPFGDHTIVHPGHGPETTLGQERQSNPFVQQIL